MQFVGSTQKVYGVAFLFCSWSLLCTKTCPGSPQTFAGAEKDVAVEFGAVKVAIGVEHCGMLTRDGSVFTWGVGSQGQLGIGKLATAPQPHLLESLQRYNVADLAVGSTHCVALTDDGSLYSWGRGHEGQTGLTLKRAPEAKHVDVTVAPKYISSLMSTPIARVSCGSQFTVAISRSGELWCWGEGGCGQLALPKVTRSPLPTRVAETAPDGNVWVDVAAGWAHCLGLCSSGRVYSWGLNCKGQLGLGDLKARSAPTQIVDPLSDSKLEEEEAVPSGSVGEFTDSVLATESFGGESKLDLDDDTPLNASVHEFSKSLRKSMTAKGEALEKTVKETMSLTPEVPPTPRAPQPTPKWDCTNRELKATVIAAGKFHSAAITDHGELYTWGASDGGRLGHALSDITVTVNNGHADFQFITPIVCPKRVSFPDFSHRIVSDVACSENATIAFAPIVLKSIQPSAGFATGCKRVTLSGDGFATLAWVRTVGRHDTTHGVVIPVVDEDSNLIEEELGQGYAVLPDVYVRFTQMVEGSSPSRTGPGVSATGPIVKYVHAYAKTPSESQPDDHSIRCISPVFGVEADVKVEVVVGALDGTQRLVRGAEKYTYFAAPHLTSVVPNCLGLAATHRHPVVKICGSGLFGTMLADKLARPLAEALVAQVNEIIERRDEAEAKAMRMLQNGGVDPDEPIEDAVMDTAPKKGAKVAKKPATKGKLEAEAAPKPKKEPPPPPGITLYTSNAVSPPVKPQEHGVFVRFVLLVDGKVKNTSNIVTGWYEGKYEEVVTAAPVKVTADSDDSDEDGDVQGVDSVSSIYSATVSCAMPTIELPSSVIDGLTDAPVISVRVEVSPNGDDFIRCGEVIQSYVTLVDGVLPQHVLLTGGVPVQLTGRAFPNNPNMMVRLDVTVKPGKAPSIDSYTAPLTYDGPSTLSFVMPRLVQQPSDAPALTPMSVVSPQRSVVSEASLAAQSCPAVIEGVGGDDVANTAPLLPVGNYPVKLLVALDGVTFEDTGLTLTAYNATLSHITPTCGVNTGGTIISLLPDAATAGVDGWYIPTGSNSVRVHNDAYDQAVGCEFVAVNKSVRATMPPLVQPTPSHDPAAEDGEAAVVSAVSDVLPPSEVSVSLAFVPGQPLESSHPIVFSYYDATKLVIKAITPASVPLAGKVTVALEGWEAVDRSQFAVRLHRLGDVPLTVALTYTFTDDGTGFTASIPSTTDGWSPGEAFVSFTIDGQYWTPVPADAAKVLLTPEGKPKK